jgi:hypothetical protein
MVELLLRGDSDLQRGAGTFRLPLLSADDLNMAKLPKAFFSQLDSKA